MGLPKHSYYKVKLQPSNYCQTNFLSFKPDENPNNFKWLSTHTDSKLEMPEYRDGQEENFWGTRSSQRFRVYVLVAKTDFDHLIYFLLLPYQGSLGVTIYTIKKLYFLVFLQQKLALWPRADQLNVNRNYWMLYIVRLFLNATDSFCMNVLPFSFSWSPAYWMQYKSWYLGSTYKGTYMMDIVNASIHCVAQNQKKITFSFQISPPSFLPPLFLIDLCIYNWHIKNCTYLRCTNW